MLHHTLLGRSSYISTYYPSRVWILTAMDFIKIKHRFIHLSNQWTFTRPYYSDRLKVMFYKMFVSLI